MRRISDSEKKLRGTYKESRSLKKASKQWNPYTSLDQVPVPDLPEYALQVYIKTADELVQQECLCPLDTEMLAAYAMQCWLIVEARKHLQEEGLTITLYNTKNHPVTQKSPYVEILNQATTLCNRLASAFGLSVVHRQKFPEFTKKDDKPNPFDGF
jgi:P27 family predicted phage terminase small subunit